MADELEEQSTPRITNPPPSGNVSGEQNQQQAMGKLALETFKKYGGAYGKAAAVASKIPGVGKAMENAAGKAIAGPPAGQVLTRSGEGAGAVAQEAVKQAIWTAIKPYLFFIIAGIAVFIIISALFMSIYDSVENKGIAGSTPVKQATEQEKNAALAAAGEKSNISALINGAAEEMSQKTEPIINKIRTSSTNDPDLNSAANCLESSLSGLYANNSVTASQKLSSCIIDLKTNVLAAELCKNNPDEAKKQGVTDCSKYTKYLAYQDEVNQLYTATYELNVMLSTTARTSLVISAKDKYYIRTGQVDGRILRALIYLVTPRSMGGAGFTKIKVRRIKSQYDDKGRSFSREWVDASGVDKADRTTSPHFRGQAMDISVVDQTPRRLYKKSIARKKIEMQDPVDILVAWQSQTAGKISSEGMPGASGDSFGLISERQAMSDLFYTLGESFGYNFSKYSIPSGSIGEIAKYMGIITLSEELGIRLDPKDDNSSLAKIFSNIGKDTVSECLDIPKPALVGKEDKEIAVNIGRAVTEKKLGLETGALKGGTSQEIYQAIGKRKVENIFGIRSGSLDYLKPGGNFAVLLGEIYIEQTLNLEGGSFASDNLNDIKTIVGDKKFEKIFANPDQINERLGLPRDQDYTQNFLTNKNSQPLKKAVGDSLIKQKIEYFRDHAVVNQTTSGGLFSQNPSVNSWTTTNKKNEAWGLPTGTIEKIVDSSDPFGSFYKIGLDELIAKLIITDDEREIFQKWLVAYPDKPLSDILYVRSDILNRFVVKTADEVKNPNHAVIDSWKSQIDQNDLDLKNVNRKCISFTESDTSYCIKTETERLQAQRKVLLEELRIAGGKIIYKDDSVTFDRMQYGNEEEWSFIEEEGINENINLPMEALSDIFKNNKANDVFYNIGKNKISFLINLNKNNLGDLNQNQFINTRLSYLSHQVSVYEDLLIDFQTKKDAGETVSQADEDFYKQGLKIWNTELRLEEGNFAGYQKRQEQYSGNPKPDCSNVNMAELIKDDFEKNVRNQAITMGIMRLGDALNLSEGMTKALTLRIQQEEELQSAGTGGVGGTTRPKPDYNALSVSVIGARHIEETLGLALYSFIGANTAELKTSLGGTNGDLTFLSKFASGINPNTALTQLPITDDNSDWFKSIFKNTDTLFGLEDNETYDLFVGNINPDKYAEKVGKAYLKTRTAANLASNLDIDINGYQPTTDDFMSLFDGDYAPILIRLGAKQLDAGLEVPIGTAKALIDNPSLECQVSVTGTNGSITKQGCLENLLAVNGQGKLAKYMGIVGQVTMSENKREIFGQEKIEEVLDKLNAQPVIPHGWFDGANLAEIAFRIPFLINPKLNEQLLSFQMYNNDGENKLLQKFGFNPSNYTLNELKNTNFITNSEPYNIAKSVDTALDIAIGTTASLFREEISVQEYKTKIQKAHVKNVTDEWVFSQFPDDIKNFLNKQNISVDDLRGYYKQSQDPKNQALLRAFINSKSNYASNKAKDNLLLGQYVIEKELDTFKQDWFMGKSIDAIVLEILLGKSKTIQIPQGLKLILGLYQNNPNLERIKSDLKNNPQNAPYLTYVEAAEQEFLQAFRFPKNKYTLNYLKGNTSQPSSNNQNIPATDIITFQSGELNCSTIQTIMQTKYTTPILGTDTSLDEILVYYKNDTDQKNYYDTWILSGTPGTNDPRTYIRSATSIAPSMVFYQCSLSLNPKTNLSATNISATPSEETSVIMFGIDDIFHLDHGVTQKFFQRKISPNQYKEAVKKAYTNYMIEDIVVDQLLPAKVKETLTKHGISVEDLKNGLENPDDLAYNTLFNFLPPAETGLVLGLLGDRINLKGEFTANFAQKQIEETLGLVTGSFSPNTTLAKVIEDNTAKKFASSFRIDFDRNLSDSEVQKILQDNILKEDTPYWTNQNHLFRAQNIDTIFKINDLESSQLQEPTKGLLTGKVTIKEYIELVRANQFKGIKPEDFVAALASNTFVGDSTEKKNKYLNYLTSSSMIISLLQDPNSAKEASTQLTLLQAFKTIGGIDLDDKAGFSPGTFGNLILNPQASKAILLAQGISSFSQKNFQNPSDMNMLLQYFIPDFIPGVTDNYLINLNPGDPNGCNLPKDRAADFNVKQKRSLCADQIIQNNIIDYVRQVTTIKKDNPDGSSTVLQGGISLPPSDVEMLLKGDTRVLQAMGFAYTVNKINADRDQNGEIIGLIPEGFQLTYPEIRDAFWPTTSGKITAGLEAGLEFEKEWTTPGDDGIARPLPTDPKSAEYDTYRTQLVEAVKDKQNKYPKQAQKEIQYKYFDAQLNALSKVNNLPSIPVGFTKRIYEGSPQERMEAFLQYGVKALWEKNSQDLKTKLGEIGGIGGDILENAFNGWFTNAVNAFINNRSNKDETSLQTFTNSLQLKTPEARTAFSNAIFEAFDTEIRTSLMEKWNIPAGVIPANFAKNIYTYADSYIKDPNTAHFADDNFAGTTRDSAIGYLCTVFDKQMSLPAGTTAKAYKIYQSVKSYNEAKRAFQVAQAVNAKQVSELGKIFTTAAEKAAANNLKLVKSNMKVGILTITVDILLSVFAEELMAFDSSLGLPPGTTASFIGMLTAIGAHTMAATGTSLAGSAGVVGIYIAAFIFVYTLVFGWSKVEMQIACPGQYPTRNPYINDNRFDPQELSAVNFLNYMNESGGGDGWCKEDNSLYTRWAQINTRRLIQDMLDSGNRSAGGKDLVPTIIGTFRKEDVDYFNGKQCDEKTGKCSEDQSKKMCDPALSPLGCGLIGIFKSDYMGDFVHIGY